jgi:hypothetical protein
LPYGGFAAIVWNMDIKTLQTPTTNFMPATLSLFVIRTRLKPMPSGSNWSACAALSSSSWIPKSRESSPVTLLDKLNASLLDNKERLRRLESLIEDMLKAAQEPNTELGAEQYLAFAAELR